MAKRKYREYLQERNGWFYFLYTIPKSCLVLNEKGKRKNQIRISLKTKCEKTAKAKSGILLAQHIAMFEANDNSPLNFDNAAKAAATLGFSPYYAPNLPTMKKIEDRIAAYSPLLTAVNTVGATPPILQAAAITGAIDKPVLPMSKLYEKFREVAPDTVKNKNEIDEANAWKKYQTIADYFVETMGDLDAVKLTPAIITEYRTKIHSALKAKKFKSDRANRYLMTLRLMYRAVIKIYDKEKFNIKDAWEGIERFTGFKDDGKRAPFTEDEVKAIRTDLEASKIDRQLLAMALVSQNTGFGIKELCFLCPEDIVLDGDTPHIKMRPNALRLELKTDERERDLPLLGASLEAMRKYAPTGFTRFNHPNGPGNASKTLREYIKKSAPKKSFIAYRHRIAELLRNSDCKDQFQNAVMGHATPGMTGHYGGPVWLTNVKKAIEGALPEDNR
ncbi:hypothetical protein MZK49_05535 [Ensifer sesbaniae]|uniref:DUF6538 domain-containing protein n=1 Tax=Ensifer sesbaniae TaxID=1214071 RepID=UPI002001BA21|nr:hypothetical protein [Ensifer sesbaniae]